MTAQELYQEVILEHGRFPRNASLLLHPTHQAEGSQPLCGDLCTMHCVVQNGVLTDIGWEGQGCVLSRASASLLSEYVQGKTETELRQVTLEVTEFFLKKGDQPLCRELEILAPVRALPLRVKCVLLPWQTLKQALHLDLSL